MLRPWSGIILSGEFSPLFPILGFPLAKLWYHVRSAILCGVELSEVLSPFSPHLRGSVQEPDLSGFWEILDVVRRAVLLGVQLSETLSPHCPGVIGLGHASGLWVTILPGVEVTEALSPSDPSYKRKKMMVRHTPIRGSEDTRNKSYFGLGRGIGKEMERRDGLGCR